MSDGQTKQDGFGLGADPSTSPSKAFLDADVAIGRVMECWHDVMSEPPSRDYHRGYNQALEDAREQLELLKFFPEN